MLNEDIERKVFYGDSIITMNDNQPKVEAIGIEGEKIIAIGKIEDVKNKMGKSYEIVDLKTKTMLPGFIDCHLHPILFMFYLINPDLSNVTSIENLLSMLKERIKNKNPDDFIIGFNLSEEKFDKPILPNRWDLDKACPDNPVFVLRYDGHIGIANTKALSLAGIDKTTEIPEGGEIRRDNEGDLTGVLSEQAMSPIFSLIVRSIDSMIKSGELRRAASQVFKIFAENGITSLHGILNYDRGGEFGDLGLFEVGLYKSVQEDILQNWYAIIFTEKVSKIKRLKKPPLDEQRKDGRFKIGCLKLFLDGTFGAKTACMYEPFSDAPGMCGFCVVDEEQIYDKMVKAHSSGFQICIHAIGDKGNRIAMDLYKRLLKEHLREDHRHRIEHASILTDDVIKDMKEFGIIASCQPPFINSEYKWLEKRLGKERCKYTYPMKSLIDAGVILVSGSDCPVEDSNVILGLHALVTRNGFIPEQCISIEDALKTYTINAAYAAFEEDIKGTIEEGKLADLVILDKNPLEIPKEEIKDIQILETIIRGKTVFKKD